MDLGESSSHLGVDQGNADPVIPIEPPALAAQSVELLQWEKGKTCWHYICVSLPIPSCSHLSGRWDSARAPLGPALPQQTSSRVSHLPWRKSLLPG